MAKFRLPPVCKRPSYPHLHINDFLCDFSCITGNRFFYETQFNKLLNEGAA